jgi:MFS family permease
MTLSPTWNDRIALAAVCLSSLMFGLEISSVPVILPTLERVLNGNFREIQWIMNAYTIACTTVLMATGTLADRFGRKRVFCIAIILFGISSLFCGLAQNAKILIVGRFLQGVTGGAMLVSQVAVLSHQFQEGEKRSRAFGRCCLCWPTRFLPWWSRRWGSVFRPSIDLGLRFRLVCSRLA